MDKPGLTAQSTSSAPSESGGGRAANAVEGGTHIRILMAEDNVINQRVGRLILQRAGFEVDVASDGNEAIEAHRSKPYDLILMDCQMPVMDGFEASRSIRRLDTAQPVIIAVTANALLGERERCLQAGMDDYLSKPFHAEELVSLVKKWSARKGSRVDRDLS